jgi:hypothetical protein
MPNQAKSKVMIWSIVVGLAMAFSGVIASASCPKDLSTTNRMSLIISSPATTTITMIITGKSAR